MTTTPGETPTAGAVGEVARGLTAVQRRALLAAAECKGGAWWTTYGDDVCDATLACSGVLTPLGLALRAHLSTTAHGREGEAG